MPLNHLMQLLLLLLASHLSLQPVLIFLESHFLTDKTQALAIGKLGHDVFRKLGESKKPTFAFINGLALGGGLRGWPALSLPKLG
jgi:hypothetical protein